METHGTNNLDLVYTNIQLHTLSSTQIVGPHLCYANPRRPCLKCAKLVLKEMKIWSEVAISAIHRSFLSTQAVICSESVEKIKISNIVTFLCT